MKRMLLSVVIWGLAAVVPLICGTVSFADDAPLAIFGETLVPIESGDIQLVNEDIDVLAHIYNPNNAITHDIPGSCEVTAVLRFRNQSKEQKTMTLGFPLDKWINDTEEGDYIKFKELNLSISVDGKRVKPRVLYDKKNGRSWFTWVQKFPAGKLVIVKHKYNQLFWGGNHIDPEGYDIHYFQYILTTGSLWVGKIERATITIHFDKDMNQANYYAIPDITKSDSKEVQWVLRDFEPKSEITFAYSWAKDKKRIKAFMTEQDQRARTEGMCVVREIKTLKVK